MMVTELQSYDDSSSPLFADVYAIRVLRNEVLIDPRLHCIKESDGSYSLRINHSLFEPLVIHYEETLVDFHVTIEKNASVELIEYFSCDSNKPSSSTITLAESARGSFYQLAEIPLTKVLSHRRVITLAKNAFLSNHCINLSPGMFNYDLDLELLEEHATADFFLLDQLYASANSAINLTIFHRALHTESTQLVRAIYADNSFGSFLGKVIVEANAAKSSAKQHYKTVLLSEHAKASVMPQLEINNFDISASHGATVGELDKSALFYLQSRGLSLDAAKMLLVSALSKEIIDRIPRNAVREVIADRVSFALKNALGVGDD